MKQRQKKYKQRGEKIEGEERQHTGKSSSDKNKQTATTEEKRDRRWRQTAAQAHVYLASNSHPKWPNMTNINKNVTDNLHLKTPCTSSTVCNSNSSNPKRDKTAAGFLHR